VSTWLKRVSRWPAVEDWPAGRTARRPLVSAGESITALLQTAGREHAAAAFLWTRAAAENGKFLAIQVQPVCERDLQGQAGAGAAAIE